MEEEEGEYFVREVDGARALVRVLNALTEGRAPQQQDLSLLKKLKAPVRQLVEEYSSEDVEVRYATFADPNVLAISAAAGNSEFLMHLPTCIERLGIQRGFLLQGSEMARMAFAPRNGKMVSIYVPGGGGGADHLLSEPFEVIKQAYYDGALPEMSFEQIAKRFA